MNKTLIFLDIVSILILISTVSFKVFFQTKSEKEYNVATYKKGRPLYKIAWSNVVDALTTTILAILIFSVLIAGILVSIYWISSCFGINFNFTAGFVFMLSLGIVSYRSLRNTYDDIKKYPETYCVGKGKEKYYCRDILMLFKTYVL
ncbi:MAG: hypothetical protein WCO35_00900 [Candidatus Nomurabacteria bacterium]